MINFFRKIRKKLADDNKPLKYLRYAIGEIVLVVVGILIALQINNWNEERKQNAERIQYQKSLYNDLVHDTLMIIEGITSYEKELSTINSIFHRLYSEDSNIDTLKIIVQKEYYPGLTAIHNLNSSTFNSMESGGKLDLFRSDLKTAILKHFLMQRSALQLLDITVKANLEQILDFNKKYPYQLGGDNYMARTAWTDINERDIVIGFNSMIRYKLHALQLNLKTYNELLNGTRDLIKVLNTYK